MHADANMRGVVAEALARLDDATKPLRVLVAADDHGEDLADFFMRLHHQHSLQEMRAQGYSTNDIVEIGETIVDVLNLSRVGINGMRMDLEIRELLLLFVLARQARSHAQGSNLLQPSERRFTSVATLLAEIDRAKAEANLEELWRNAIDTDVHKAISSLRAKLAAAGLNRNLIEGKRGSGYRLSTPHWNIITPTTAAVPASRHPR